MEVESIVRDVWYGDYYHDYIIMTMIIIYKLFFN